MPIDSVRTDGRFLIVRMANQQTVNADWVLPVEGERKPFGYLQSNKLF